MEPMRVLWAGLVVVVQPPAETAWGGPSADHDRVLQQVSAWLTGLRQGVQAAPPLPAFPVAPPPPRRETPTDDPDTPLPGFYL